MGMIWKTWGQEPWPPTRVRGSRTRTALCQGQGGAAPAVGHAGRGCGRSVWRFVGLDEAGRPDGEAGAESGGER